MRPSLEPAQRPLIRRQNRAASVGPGCTQCALRCCTAALPTIQPFAARMNYVDQIRFISVLTVRRRNWRPILRPHLCGEENFIVFGRSSALSGRLLGVRPWISKRGFWDFPPLLAMKRRWALFAFPRRIIQRPSEMTGRAVPAAIPVKLHTKA